MTTTLAPKNKLQVLHFVLQNVRFCVDIQYLEKVLSLVLIEAIPNSPSYLVGLMNLAGQSIPIIDLAVRLGFKRREQYSLDTPILLCSEGNHRAGFIIDNIVELADVSPLSIQMNDEFQQEDSPFLAAIALETEVSLLVNMQNMLNYTLTEHSSFKMSSLANAVK
jgi:purine-binding chemotaxis protein CheW